VATSQAFGSSKGSPGRCSDRSRSHQLCRSAVWVEEGAVSRAYLAREAGVRRLEAVRDALPKRETVIA
jgi:hypothetical protein